MKYLSRSTSHMILNPRVASLVLAALRLRIHLRPSPRLALKEKR